MTSRSQEVKYTCLNDCQQAGCPGHKVVAIYSHTSDTLSFETVTGLRQEPEREGFDENAFKAMMEAYNSIRW